MSSSVDTSLFVLLGKMTPDTDVFATTAVARDSADADFDDVAALITDVVVLVVVADTREFTDFSFDEEAV